MSIRFLDLTGKKEDHRELGRSNKPSEISVVRLPNTARHNQQRTFRCCRSVHNILILFELNNHPRLTFVIKPITITQAIADEVTVLFTFKFVFEALISLAHLSPNQHQILFCFDGYRRDWKEKEIKNEHPRRSLKRLPCLKAKNKSGVNKKGTQWLEWGRNDWNGKTFALLVKRECNRVGHIIQFKYLKPNLYWDTML